jgi:hypothetical protein
MVSPLRPRTVPIRNCFLSWREFQRAGLADRRVMLESTPEERSAWLFIRWMLEPNRMLSGRYAHLFPLRLDLDLLVDYQASIRNGPLTPARGEFQRNCLLAPAGDARDGLDMMTQT